eukprot:6464521-Amphidinium_carterae.4
MESMALSEIARITCDQNYVASCVTLREQHSKSNRTREGGVIGIFTGCCLGLLNLFIIDTNVARQMKLSAKGVHLCIVSWNRVKGAFANLGSEEEIN